MLAADALLSVVSWNERCAAVLSFVVNLALILMILTRTPDKLRDYSHALFCNCVADLFFTTISVIVQPIISIEGTFGVLVPTGVFVEASIDVRYLASTMLFFAAYTATFAVSVPFVCRYSQLCRGHQVGKRGLALAFFVSTSAAFTIWIVAYISLKPLAYNANLRADALRGSVAFVDIDNLDFRALLSIAICLGLQVANYGVILFCSCKIRVLMGMHEASQSVRAVHKQITRVMILQALTPLVLAVVPTMTTLVLILCGIPGILVLQLTYPILAWLPVLNGFYAICFVKAYREVFTRRFTRIESTSNGYASNSQASGDAFNRQQPYSGGRRLTVSGY